MRASRIFALSLFLLLVSASARSQEFVALCVGVADGDTITVLREKKQIRIRLHAIDCPESAQPFGNKAKQFTASKVFQKTVKVKPIETDKYGRTVAVIYTGDGNSLNEEIVRAGLGWWYHQYGPSEKHIALAEIEARAARRGLWKDSNPQPAWAYRNPPKRDSSQITAAPNRTRGAVTERPSAPVEQSVFITRTGAKFHRDGCRYLSRSQIPISPTDARRSYSACSVCNP